MTITEKDILDNYIRDNFGDIEIGQKTRDSVKDTFGYKLHYIATKNAEIGGLFTKDLLKIAKKLDTKREQAIKRYLKS